MNKKTMQKLEFDIILDMLASHAGSTLAKSMAKNLKPSTDLKEIIAEQELTQEAVDLIFSHSNIPLGAIYDTKAYILLAQKGGMLNPKKLLEIADTLRSAHRIKRFLSGKEEIHPRICHIAQKLSTQPEIVNSIERCISGENTISDNASTNLYKIRRSIESKQARIREKLDSMIASNTNQKYLQDSLITIRNDRFVIPVKSEYKSYIDGLIHDQSAKGSTLYIEPIAVVNLNNELASLSLKEQDEIQRILYELSAMVAEVAPQVLENTAILAQIDFIIAKGKLSHEYTGIKPEIRNDRYLKIRNGRHPLIDPAEVVPTNLWLGRDFTSLLVTGPNTGGKTVTLKTVGLFALMAQAGLQLPAGSGTQICIFDNIFADIGDEQSIAQSLSTFSSHMKNIVSILSEFTGDSLVLFDELGAGTDPTEGAALAISILEHLRRVGTMTIATTHYAELKQYALSTPGVENASMEFDIGTLSPTFRLLVGIPGKSNAFEISKKLGLTSSIIERAKSLMTTQNVEFEEILAKLEHSRKLAQEEQEEAIRIRLDSERIKQRLNEKEKKWLEQKEKIEIKARTEARAILKNAKKILKETRESLTINKIDSTRAKISEQLENLSPKFLEKDAINEDIYQELDEGDIVIVLSLKKEGRVLIPANEKDEVLVIVGSMKMTVQKNRLMLVKKNPDPSKEKSNKSQASFASSSISPEIDVRGQNIEEARVTLDKYIDQLEASSLNKARIIHGKGTGALRTGLHAYFRQHPSIKNHSIAGFNEGGAGATNIELK